MSVYVEDPREALKVDKALELFETLKLYEVASEDTTSRIYHVGSLREMFYMLFANNETEILKKMFPETQINKYWNEFVLHIIHNATIRYQNLPAETVTQLEKLMKMKRIIDNLD